nr:hypothetical protein MarFTME_045 [Marseillevirus futianmevirus]
MEMLKIKSKASTKFHLYLDGVSFSGKVKFKDFEAAKEKIQNFLEYKTTEVCLSKNFSVRACVSSGVTIKSGSLSVDVRQEWNHFNVKKVREFFEELHEKLQEQ